MTADYSMEKFNKVGEESLKPEDKEKLEKFRALKMRWLELSKDIDPNTSAVEAVVEEIIALIKGFRELLRPEQMEYVLGVGEEAHDKLGESYSETKEGQMEIAHMEANVFNEAFDSRYNRLQKAIKDRKNDPQELITALTHFDAFVKELNEGDLRSYSDAVRNRKTNPGNPFNKKEPEDIEPTKSAVIWG
ncbi:MAG: hypothetical protein NT098_05235 [Candidatus Parcubacteria bacterium]|nr:hypothetical protein [Candidatus Parcubacteria bacterium]